MSAPAARYLARPLVGRARELAQVSDGIDDVLGGRGRLYFIVGEPGIGKTRLLDEIAANDHNLNISRYVHVGVEVEDLDVAEEVEKLLELQAQRDAAEAKMMGFLKELGYVA